MTQFVATPEYISDAAQQCDNTAFDVMTQLTNLQTFVTNLVGEAGTSQWNGPANQASVYTWLGVSASQFAEMMSNLHIYSVAMHDALVDIGEGLRGNYVNYVNSEADNLRGLQGIDGNLINTPSNPQGMPVTPQNIPPANL
jgi:uncharacterized protein YukE